MSGCKLDNKKKEFKNHRMLASVSFICLSLALQTLVSDIIRKNMATGKMSFSQNPGNLKISCKNLKKKNSLQN